MAPVSKIFEDNPAPVTRKPSARFHKHATHIEARDPDGRTVRIHQRDIVKPA